MLLFIASGVFAGIISGMGIGGGILLIPVLLFFGGLGQKEAQMINLLYFLPTAAVALVVHIRAHRVRKERVGPLLFGGVFGALAGSLLAVHMDARWLKILYGLFLVVMGVSEIRKGRKNAKSPRPGENATDKR